MEENAELTPKQREWLRLYTTPGTVQFGNATQSAMLAYGLSPEQYDSARTIGKENIAKLHIQLSDLMDEMGLTDNKLLQKLEELLNSTRPMGEKMIDYPDNPSRNKALELALKLKNRLVDKVEIQGGFFTTQKLEIEVVNANQAQPETTTDSSVTE